MDIYYIKRSIKYWWQRRTRGWDDSETWALDLTIAEFILPRLKRFKELTHGYPSNLTEKQWDKRLDKMILAFEAIVKDDFLLHPDKQKEVKEGLELFCKYYIDLWD